MLKKSAVLAGVCLGFCVAVVLSFAPQAEATRNASGTYSLPAGNPVTTGTTITSTWANTTLSDISTELTSSLDRSGRGSMLAALKLYGGSLATPGLSFSSETNSGLFRNAAGDIRFGVGGNLIQKWTTGGVAFSNATAATGGTRQDAVTLTNGDLNMDGVAAPTSTTAVKNRLTPVSMVKAWGYLSGTTPTVNAAFNVSSVSCSANHYTVNLAQAFTSSTSYAVLGTAVTGGNCASVQVTYAAAGQFYLYCNDSAGSTVNLCTTPGSITFLALGPQ